MKYKDPFSVYIPLSVNKFEKKTGKERPIQNLASVPQEKLYSSEKLITMAKKNNMMDLIQYIPKPMTNILKQRSEEWQKLLTMSLQFLSVTNETNSINCHIFSKNLWNHKKNCLN